MRANTSVTVVPEGNRSPIVGSDTGARVALDGTDTDGVTRYPSQGGNIIGADDIAKYDNNEPPKQGGNDNE